MAQTRGVSKDEMMETKILSTLPTPPVPLMRSHDEVAPYTLSNGCFYLGYRSCGVQLTSTTNCFMVNPNPTAPGKAPIWPKWSFSKLPEKTPSLAAFQRISFITCNNPAHITFQPSRLDH